MCRVAVIGSANMDFTVRLERLPRMGETVSNGEFYTSFGGKGANQAVAAHKAGAQVRFLARVGKDSNGDAIREHLASQGLNCSFLVSDESNPSGVALIMVDEKGNNSIAVAPGSNRYLKPHDILNAKTLILWAHVLLIQLEVPLPAVREALRMAKAHGLVTILNPAPAHPLPKRILGLVDILTPNETELGLIAKREVHDPKHAVMAAQKLMETGIGQVVVTLGKEGSCWVSKDSVQSFPPFPVPAVDSTGAGDAFNGVLACSIAEKRPMKEAILRASAAGAITVTRKGAQESLPTRDEIENLLKQSMK